ncbi:MAG TPA: hypothetical protein VMU39_22520 [Solirubrobacteraceae bacterium]|nr:hypothetical protein [Solirubrobacteraceae bacterium]
MSSSNVRGWHVAVATSIVAAVGWAAPAVLAANGPTPAQLKAIGSTSQAAHTEPLTGVGAVPSTAPLIAISFVGNRATVIGGSAVSGRASKDARTSNIPASAVLCSVNFTTRRTRISSSSTAVRWFSGVGCSRSVELFGQAFLVESASKFDASGRFYKGQLKTVSSGQANTVLKESNPSLYVWSATNIYFQEKPSRGVVVVQPSPNQRINGATKCSLVKNTSFGWGVHCDLYTNRF